MMRVSTESGAVYEFQGDRVRRVGSHVKRGDGEWQALRSMRPETPTVGLPMVLVMDSFDRYGVNDYGVVDGGSTTRRTTAVVAVESEETR